jgi:hypothetical protein
MSARWGTRSGGISRHGKLEVTRNADGRVRIGQPTQGGFAALTVAWGDLVEAVDGLAGHRSTEG